MEIIKSIRAVLALPKEIANLADCITCHADEVVRSVKSNGVALDKLRQRPVNSGKDSR